MQRFSFCSWSSSSWSFLDFSSHDKRKQHWSDWILSSGIWCPIQVLIHPLHCISGHLCDHHGMILLTKADSRFQTSMYFFLQHLAFVDICYSSAITSKMLKNFILENKSISFEGCVMQLMVYATFAPSDCYVLAAVVMDH